MSEYLIEIQGLEKRFPGNIKAVVDLTLSIYANETLVVVGPSGSGKSTLLRCLCGLETIDAGRVVIDGLDLSHEAKNLDRIRQEMGMVFQSFNLFPHLTVLENLNLAPRHVRGLSLAQATENSTQLLEKVGLCDKRHSYPNQLSGGQQQRVAIARALAMNPKVIMFDEATSALDPEMTTEVLAVMKNLALEGTTMIVVTHEMSFAREAGDRVALMAEGRLIEVAPVDTFFHSPQEARTREFLGLVK